MPKVWYDEDGEPIDLVYGDWLKPDELDIVTEHDKILNTLERYYHPQDFIEEGLG
jgi:hypothetical protein